jgi:hypothetical protein
MGVRHISYRVSIRTGYSDFDDSAESEMLARVVEVTTSTDLLGAMLKLVDLFATEVLRRPQSNCYSVGEVMPRR